MVKGDAVSAKKNLQADAALELGVLQVNAARPGGGGGGHRLLRLRVAAVGGHPPSLSPRFRLAWRRERSGGIVRKKRRTVGPWTTEPA